MENLGLNFRKAFDNIFEGKRILITGHTGFKGSWLSIWLSLLGAEIIGYALDPKTKYDNFVLCELEKEMSDVRGNILDKNHLKRIFDYYRPEIVFHMAAQPLVQTSYKMPSETFETNIAGTVNVLENIRILNSVKACIIVTSDKCYENKEQFWGYRENDSIGGFDPYSASKGCAELVTNSYRKSYNIPVSTVRAGNVIGGGDWSLNRIIPDCVRALQVEKPIEIRNPDSIRPWQFVLEPLYGYLLLASKMLIEPEKYCGAWNFGPEFDSIVSVKYLVQSFIRIWGCGNWKDMSDSSLPPEAGLLNLDCTKSKRLLGFKQRFNLNDTLANTIQWYKTYKNCNVLQTCTKQIADYLKL